MKRHRGFALVLALGVIGIVTAMLTLTLLVASSYRVQANAARNRSEMRQQALLALDEAIANLQILAGPDQRTTAPAADGTWLAKEATAYSWTISDNAAKAQDGIPPVSLPARIRQQVALGRATAAFGLLTDPQNGGLRRNLSTEPALLGDGYEAWANYAGYMENPAEPSAPAPSPAYGSDPLRRRHRMSPPSPVLTYFLLTFNIRTQAGSSAVKPVEARVRWMMTLWNPYTSAFVPENLRLEVSGLTASLQLVDETAGGATTPISLAALYGDPLRIALPWDSALPDPERQSWLPGRVYTWTALENLSGTPPAAGYASRFNSRNLSADAGQGIQKKASDVAIDGDDICHLIVSQPQTLIARLYVVRAAGDILLATFNSPTFAPFTTTPRKLSAGTYQFSYLFRLAESFDTPASPGTWLQSPAAYLPGANGNRPELYENYVTISSPDRLLDRAGNAMSYNEDVPLFELPRAPILSLGVLQHLPPAQTRPFSVGNPWGTEISINGIPANSIFDRFYLSPIAASPMPHAVLGAFNVNSIDPAAWKAVLQTAVFDSSSPFTYLDASAVSGTGPDSPLAQLTPVAANFFRFAQSAQETAKAEAPTGAPPYANTHLFRNGRRELSDAQVAVLAGAIVQLNAARRAVSGPWRSMEEFLNAGVFTDAIGMAALNAGVAEFSSQWLTAADVLTPIAPILFVRSDSFTIRVEVDSTAVLEATVVRTADYIDSTDPSDRPTAALNSINAHLGRRFRIVSFKWLNNQW